MMGRITTMSVQSLFSAAARFDTAPARRVARHGVRWAMIGVGAVLILVGGLAQLTPLPIHFPALLVVVAGLVLVLRTERMVLPRRWRFAGATRRRMVRSRRKR